MTPTLDQTSSLRPLLHFTPARGWMNDPNGLIYYAGEYHLFYQHYPHDIIWGPMHWGHAVSRDLVHWEHLPIALYPDAVGNIFSGSIVVDWLNTAGFGSQALVAVFTHDANGRQMQSLAYSIDRGRTWTKYAGNPIVEPPDDQPDFRDPKVFWHEGAQGGHWVMLLAAGRQILFYTSSNLIDWSQSGSFGPGWGSTDGVWETPELFKLPVDGGAQTRWLLSVAVGDGAPAGGSGVQYFVGDFDGSVFSSENSQATVLWVDHGADFYAPQAWNEAPGGRALWIAWMTNWSYARQTPADLFRGAATFPRQLALTATPDGVRLRQALVPELQQLRGQRWLWENERIAGSSDLTAAVRGQELEVIADFDLRQEPGAALLGVRVHSGSGEFTTVGYRVAERQILIDRTHSGRVDFNPTFAALHAAPLDPIDGKIRLHLFVDRSSLELLANDGLVALTEQIFPTAAGIGIELFSEGGAVLLTRLEVYALHLPPFSEHAACGKLSEPRCVGLKDEHDACAGGCLNPDA